MARTSWPRDSDMEESIEAQACGGRGLLAGARRGRDVPLELQELSLTQQILAATAGGIATALFGGCPHLIFPTCTRAAPVLSCTDHFLAFMSVIFSYAL